MLAVLRRRDFGLLWLAGLVSVAGDWVLNAALPYFVYQQTGSTIATAGMTVAELLPAVALSSVAGVFVDRWDRRRVLVGTCLLQAVAVSLLLLCDDGNVVWMVYVVALVASVLSSFAVPAESALLPTLVEDADLISANSLNALNNRLGRLLGLPLGAALLTTLGLSGVAVVDCCSFLLAALLLALMSGRPPVRRLEDESAVAEATTALARFWADWVDGLRLVGREPSISLVFIVLGIMTFGGTMLDPLSPAWVRDVLGQGPAVYAWLMVAHAIGGVAGSFLVGTLGRALTPRQLMGWCSLAAGVVLLVKFNVATLPVAVSLSLVTGVTSVASSVGVDTLVQRSIRDEYRGRVFGALGSTCAVLSLIGAATGGVLGATIGLVPTLDVAAALVGLSGGIVLVVYARGRAVARTLEPVGKS